MLIKVNERQLAHVLAGLRLLQAHANDDYIEAHNFEEIIDPGTEMTADELDGFCHDLNGGDAVVDEKDLSYVETQWAERCEVLGFTGKKRLNNQAEFFAGAMSARIAAGMEPGAAMPPRWVISIMRGDQL